MTPTLSQVQSYKTDHLTTAARFWTSTADTWETVFNRVRLDTHEMGWQGMAAEVAMHASHDDWQHVIGHSDTLRDAASTAARAAQELAGAQRQVLDTVDEIQNQGFAVGEDFSVTDRTTGNTGARAARMALAQQLSAELRSKVAAFLTREESTGLDLTRSAASLGKVGFSTAHGRSKASTSNKTVGRTSPTRLHRGTPPVAPHPVGPRSCPSTSNASPRPRHRRRRRDRRCLSRRRRDRRLPSTARRAATNLGRLSRSGSAGWERAS
jgi:hypothetical protein